MNKYAHFINEMSGYKCTLTCFEVSTLGYITQRNNTHLKTLHGFLNPGIKYSIFWKNIEELALYSSYHIFLCRSEPSFIEPPYLQPSVAEKHSENMTTN